MALDYDNVSNIAIITNSSFNRSLSTALSYYSQKNVTEPVNKHVRALLSFLLALMIVISVSGNFIVCYIVYRKPAMRSGINLLLANLALSDLLMSVVPMPMAITFLNLQSLQINEVACTFSAILFFKLQTEKIFLLVTISVDRYYIIVKRRDNLNTFRARIISLSIWFGSLMLTIPPMFGWGIYTYQSMQCQCMLKLAGLTAPDVVYVFFFNIISGLLPCAIMVVCYGLILRKVRRNCFRVQNHPPVNPTAMHRKGKLFIDYSYKTRTFTTISMLSFIYIACILPLKIVEISAVITGTAPSYSTMLGVICLSYSHTALNPIIYTIRIKKFREACIEALPKACLMFPKFVPLKTRQRIRPYALYEVSRDSNAITTVI
eukprot:gene523-1174_t